jgi:PEP-CTERM motif
MRCSRLLIAATMFALASSTLAAHADTMTGQFSLQGTLINTGTALNFSIVETGAGTQTGSFTTLLSDNELVIGNPVLTYSPTYTPGSEVFVIGSLTVDLETFAETAAGLFSGTALLSAPGFTNTDAIVSLTTQLNSGPVTFSATAVTPSPSVPEPSTFVLLGTGILGLAGVVRLKFLHQS